MREVRFREKVHFRFFYTFGINWLFWAKKLFSVFVKNIIKIIDDN